MDIYLDLRCYLINKNEDISYAIFKMSLKNSKKLLTRRKKDDIIHLTIRLNVK